MSQNPKIDIAVAMYVIKIIQKWWSFRQGTDYRTVITDPRRFAIEAEHSLRGGLLGRMLLEGKDPLPIAPPIVWSRPWYSLIEKGEGEVLEVWAVQAQGDPDYIPQPGDDIVVGQSDTWKFVSLNVPGDWIIEHPNVGKCSALKIKGLDFDKWRIKVLG